MTSQQELIVNAVTAWNSAIGDALKTEFNNHTRDDTSDLISMLTLALTSLDRNPAATRANLQNALDALRNP